MIIRDELLARSRYRGANSEFREPCDRHEPALGDQEHGILATRRLSSDIGPAVAWLRTKACELFPNSRFADRYGRRHGSPYVPGTPKARAAGCICHWRDPDREARLVEPRCP